MTELESSSRNMRSASLLHRSGMGDRVGERVGLGVGIRVGVSVGSVNVGALVGHGLFASSSLLVTAPKMHFPLLVLHPQPTRFTQAGAHRRLSQRLSVGELEGPDVVGFTVGAGVGGRLDDGVGATDGIEDAGALVRQHELPHITEVSASRHALTATAMTASQRSFGQRFSTHDTAEGPWVGM